MNEDDGLLNSGNLIRSRPGARTGERRRLLGGKYTSTRLPPSLVGRIPSTRLCRVPGEAFLQPCPSIWRVPAEGSVYVCIEGVDTKKTSVGGGVPQAFLQPCPSRRWPAPWRHIPAACAPLSFPSPLSLFTLHYFSHSLALSLSLSASSFFLRLLLQSSINAINSANRRRDTGRSILHQFPWRRPAVAP